MARNVPCLGPRCNLGQGGTSLFRCTKKALKVTKRGPSIAFWCTYLNDECIGAKCQYASCDARAMSPQGLCLYVPERREDVRDIVDEAKKIEGEVQKLERHLKKLGLKDYF